LSAIATSITVDPIEKVRRGVSKIVFTGSFVGIKDVPANVTNVTTKKPTMKKRFMVHIVYDVWHTTRKCKKTINGIT